VDDCCFAIYSFSGRGQKVLKLFEEKKHIFGLGCLAFFYCCSSFSVGCIVVEGISLIYMVTKHFLKTLLLFTTIIVLGLGSVFLVNYFAK
jgi:hypothetical protein